MKKGKVRSVKVINNNVILGEINKKILKNIISGKLFFGGEIFVDDNYYEINDEVMCLDKDILFKNNKIYSNNTCIFVPQFINTLFCKRQNDRGEYQIKKGEFADVLCKFCHLKTKIHINYTN